MVGNFPANMYTKLNVYFSWNFIICNVHKRNKERRNVFKVFIHNLQRLFTRQRQRKFTWDKTRERYEKFHQNTWCGMWFMLNWNIFHKHRKVQLNFHSKNTQRAHLFVWNFSIAVDAEFFAFVENPSESQRFWFQHLTSIFGGFIWSVKRFFS